MDSISDYQMSGPIRSKLRQGRTGNKPRDGRRKRERQPREKGQQHTTFSFF